MNRNESLPVERLEQLDPAFALGRCLAHLSDDSLKLLFKLEALFLLKEGLFFLSWWETLPQVINILGKFGVLLGADWLGECDGASAISKDDKGCGTFGLVDVPKVTSRKQVLEV